MGSQTAVVTSAPPLWSPGVGTKGCGYLQQPRSLITSSSGDLIHWSGFRSTLPNPLFSLHPSLFNPFYEDRLLINMHLKPCARTARISFRSPESASLKRHSQNPTNYKKNLQKLWQIPDCHFPMETNIISYLVTGLNLRSPPLPKGKSVLIEIVYITTCICTTGSWWTKIILYLS